MAQAVKLHGVKRDLVLYEDVLAMLTAAYNDGVQHGLLMAKVETQPKE